MIRGNHVVQPVHKGKEFPKDYKYGLDEFAVTACGGHWVRLEGTEVTKGEHTSHILWSENWEEVTCKNCLKLKKDE